MSIDPSITHDWIIPVLTNLIAVALLALIRPAGKLISALAKRGKFVVQDQLRVLKRARNVARLKYSIFVGISLINIPLNCYFVWHKASIPGSPTRMEVVELVAMCAIVLFWLGDFIYKIRNYGVSDYLSDEA
jgi:hypothetical protein